MPRTNLWIAGPLLAWLFASATAAEPGSYEPTWESLDTRRTPGWFDEAKFGIFIHWGLYSVPAYAPTAEGHIVREYAEWYRHWMDQPDHPTYAWHRQRYGKHFAYADFAPMFRAELWDPEAWAELLARSGARYVVTTAKHADGYCLWPSPCSWNFNSVDTGPHRDLIGDLVAALRKQNLRVGLYYCFFEWGHPWYPADMSRFVTNRSLPQLFDLARRYEPDLMWGDGAWKDHSDDWRSREFLAWLFNASTVRDKVVVNDRWGKETRSKHGGYFTTEYRRFHTIDDLTKVKWEECRGLGTSFGYNRNEKLADYLGPRELVLLLVSTVAEGGNLLLNIGPRADGTIPVIMEERLRQIGDWLDTNGEAIYGTRPWVRACQWTEGAKPSAPSQDTHASASLTLEVGFAPQEGTAVREAFFTRNNEDLYAILPGWPGTRFILKDIAGPPDIAVTLLGHEKPIPFEQHDGNIILDLSGIPAHQLPCGYAYTFRIRGAAVTQ